MNINHKLNSWLQKSLEPKTCNEFNIIAMTNDGAIIVRNGQRERLKSAVIAYNFADTLEIHTNFNGSPESLPADKIYIAVKNGSKCIIYDHRYGYFSFGLKDHSNENINAVITAESEHLKAVILISHGKVSLHTIQIPIEPPFEMSPECILLPELLGYLPKTTTRTGGTANERV